MKFLPYENYDLKTNLGVDEVQNRLADNIGFFLGSSSFGNIENS